VRQQNQRDRELIFLGNFGTEANRKRQEKEVVPSFSIQGIRAGR